MIGMIWRIVHAGLLALVLIPVITMSSVRSCCLYVVHIGYVVCICSEFRPTRVYIM